VGQPRQSEALPGVEALPGHEALPRQSASVQREVITTDFPNAWPESFSLASGEVLAIRNARPRNATDEGRLEGAPPGWFPLEPPLDVAEDEERDERHQDGDGEHCVAVTGQ